MGDLIANLKAVQDAAIAAAASQPGIDISQVLLLLRWLSPPIVGFICICIWILLDDK